MADDDFDDSLLEALEQYERQHVPIDGQIASASGAQKAAAARGPQPQQQPSRQPLQVHVQQLQQPPQQQQWNQQQQQHQQNPQQQQHFDYQQQSQNVLGQQRSAADINQIWGIFCSGPPPAPSTAASSGWANKRLQKWNSSKTPASQQHTSAHQGQAAHLQHGQSGQQQGPARMQQGQSSSTGQQQGLGIQQPYTHVQQPGMPPQQQAHAQQHQNASANSMQGSTWQQHHHQQHPASWQQHQQPQQHRQQHQQQPWQQQQVPAHQQQRQQWQQDYQQQQQQQHAGLAPSTAQQQQQQQTGWMPPPLQRQHQQQQGAPPSYGAAVPPVQQHPAGPASMQQHGTSSHASGGCAAGPAPAGSPAAAAAAPGTGAAAHGHAPSDSGPVGGAVAVHHAAAGPGSTGMPGCAGAGSVPGDPAAAGACRGAAPSGPAAAGACMGAVSGGLAGAGACMGAMPGSAVSGSSAAGVSGSPAAPGAFAAGMSGGAAAGMSGGPAAATCAGGMSGGPAVGSGGPAGSGGPPVVYSAKLALGRDRQIEVVFSGWHNAIAAVCSTIPGCRRADGNSWGRTWLVPADKVGALQQALEANLPPNVRISKIDPLPDLVRNVLGAADKRPDDTQLYETLEQLTLGPGESLADRMRPFQRDGVKFGLRAGGRVLIGDEMGLGKTVQACALARCYQQEWPVLVVTPSSLRLSWAAALYQWLRVTEDRVLVTLKRDDMRALANAPTEKDAQAMYDFVIVSYDMLKDTSAVLEAMKFKVVILDESHCIKSPQAQRTKFAKPLVECANRAILLSGTPALSNPSELLTQLQALLPKARITKKAFEERYMDIRNFGKFTKAVGGKNGEELNRLLTSTVMIRRKKAEVLKDLPAKNRNQVPLLLDAAKRKELDNYKSTLNEIRQLSANMAGVGAAVGGGLLAGMEQQQRSMVMELWHKTAQIKAKAVTDYVKELLLNSDPDDKFLVFAYHRDLMDAIEKGVNEVKDKNKEMKAMRYMRIDGSTPAQQRQENVTTFQDEPNCRVAILNIKAAGVGLTLTRASTVVFAELAWTPSEVQQAEDRAHRIGQTQSVNVHLLLVKDSIDDLMWELLQNKLATTGQVLDGHATRMEVQRSNTQQGKGKGGGSGGPRGGGAPQLSQQPAQPSITNFFAANGPANKKQRSH